MNVKKITVIFLLIFATYTLKAQNHVNISGENNATYIYRTAKDSLKNYFEDELKLRLDYKNFTFGMTFKADLPKYDKYQATEELHPNQINTEWTDRFVQLNYDNFRIKAGTIEEAFGAGLILRSWNDTDLERDKRLEGAQAHFIFNNIKIASVYGALKEDIPEQLINQNDLIAGADIEVRALSSLTIGYSVVQYKQKNILTNKQSYTHWNVFGGRVSYLTDLFDIYTEYSELRRVHNIPNTQIGSAIYSSANIYLGKLTLSSGYKRYSRYQYALSDLPTLNHYDELLYSYADIDFEEGLMGEIRYTPDFDNELVVNYAESWNRDFKVRHSNLFTEYRRNFSNFTITLDYEHLEKKQDNNYIWEKELRPSVSLDLFEFYKPMTIKFLWSYNEEEHFQNEKSYHKPYLQIDSRITNNLSIAVFGEYQFNDWDQFGDNSIYLGTEFVTAIARHTEVKLFIGKEKGGKVCRNGVCQFQAPFEGLRLSLSTKF